MKKFIIVISFIVGLFIASDYAYYHLGIYVDLHPEQEVATFMKTDHEQIYMEGENGYAPFEIKGVNLGSGEPGEWSTDFPIGEETYLRWFRYIQEMGANTIRVYTIQAEDFYNS